MARKKNMAQLARKAMEGILRNGRVTTIESGESKTTITREPSAGDLKLALEMAKNADSEGDHASANKLREAYMKRKAMKGAAGLTLVPPPVSDADDAATRTASA